MHAAGEVRRVMQLSLAVVLAVLVGVYRPPAWEEKGGSDLPARLPQETGGAGLEGVRFCRWSDVEVEPVPPPTAGNLMFGVRLAADKSHCALPWQPAAWIVDAGGRRHAVRSYPDLYPSRLLLARKIQAFGGVSVDSACRVEQPLALVVALPEGSERVAQTSGLPCNTRTPLRISATDFVWNVRR